MKLNSIPPALSLASPVSRQIKNGSVGFWHSRMKSDPAYFCHAGASGNSVLQKVSSLPGFRFTGAASIYEIIKILVYFK